MTSRQWFGGIYTSFTATAPAVVEHSSPTDLKPRKISSITVPPGRFTDGDKEEGRWGRQPHSCCKGQE